MGSIINALHKEAMRPSWNPMLKRATVHRASISGEKLVIRELELPITDHSGTTNNFRRRTNETVQCSKVFSDDIPFCIQCDNWDPRRLQESRGAQSSKCLKSSIKYLHYASLLERRVFNVGHVEFLKWGTWCMSGSLGVQLSFGGFKWLFKTWILFSHSSYSTFKTVRQVLNRCSFLWRCSTSHY